MADRGSGAAGFSPGDFAGTGLQFVLAILLFLFLGKWIDARLGTAPVFLIVGTFVGAGAGFYSMYRKVTGATRRNADGKGDRKGGGGSGRGVDRR